MARLTIYSTGTCPMCEKAKSLLQKWGIPYDEKRVDTSREYLKEMQVVSNGARTVPQIVIDSKCIGGFSDLTELHMDGDLDDLQEG